MTAERQKQIGQINMAQMQGTRFAMMAAWLGLMLACQHLMAVTVTITNGVTGSGLILGTGIYEIGARVTLRAAPQVDWKFDHWDGIPAELFTNNPVSFEATVGINPIAVFLPAVGNGRFNGGTVVAWGWNSLGQADVPKAATNIISIAAGLYHTVALRKDGLLLAWGSISYGGSGGVFYSNYVESAVSVSALNYRKHNGDVFGFYGSPAVLSQAAATKTQFLGDNVAVLDDGSIKILNGFKEPPVKVSGIIQADTSYAHQWGLAVRKDGSVYGWGEDGFGGWKIPSNISNIVQVSAGQFPALAIRNDGLILAWGSDATSVPNQSSGAISISAGNQHAVAALRDGTVLAWGQGQYQSTEIPVGLKGVMQVAAGSYHCAALSVNGIQCSGGIDDYYSVKSDGELLIQPIIYVADRFQWYKDGAKLVSETNISINVKSVSSKDGGSYQLLVSSATESLLTPPSIVRILPVDAPIFDRHPQSVNTTSGSDVILTASAKNHDVLLWFKDGTALLGLTNATLTLTNVQPFMIGDYTAVVSNAAGSVTSSAANLSIKGVDSGIWKGLVAYYPFNGNANDESVYSNNLELFSSAAFPSPVDYQGLDRNGFPNKSVNLKFANNFKSKDGTVFPQVPCKDFTICYWRKGIGRGPAVSIGTVGVEPVWKIGDTAANTISVAYNISGGLNLKKDFNDFTRLGLSAESWSHVVVLWSGSKSSIYLNGVLWGAGNNYNFPDVQRYSVSDTLYIGASTRSNDGGLYYFNSEIDDVRIYNRVLSDAEVKALYDSESVPPIIDIVSPVIYSTTGTGTEFYGVGTSIANGHRGYEYGDEISLPSVGYSFTGLTFDYYSASLSGSMNLNIYANDGAVISGRASPGTKLLSIPGFVISSGINTVTFDYKLYVAQYGQIKLPKNFTVAISFSGATSAADKGLIFGGAESTAGRPQLNVGDSASDFWQKTGPGTSDWALRTLSGVDANFKITVHASDPEIVPINPVSIISQPTNITAVLAQDILFSVTATNALSYQWFKDSNAVPGGTNAALTWANVQPVAIGDYRVVVGNSVGSVTSAVATLTMSGVNASAWKGVIAQYRLDGSGADASLFGHDGTNRGGLRFGIDRYGQANAALAFNGVSSSYEDEDRCDVGALSADSLSTLTFMGWVRLASRKDFHTLFSGTDGSGLYLSKDGIAYRWYPQNLEAKVSTTLGLNRWYHVAAAFSGTTVSFYVDGQKVGSTTANAGYPVVPLQGVNLGARGYGNVYYTLNGGLDDVRFYNRELAASDVLEIFNSEKPSATQGAVGEFLGYGVYKAGVAVDSAALMQSVPKDLTQVAQITGFRHPLVLKSDGSVVSWGGSGSLPANLRKAVKVAAGENTDVVLHDDGTVSFSSNFEAPETSRALLKGIVDTAANWDRVSFLNSEGRVFTFFYNNVLTNIPYSGEVVGLWRGADYGHVLQADGTVKDWDEMSAVRSHFQPLEKLGITDFVQIDGGFGLTRGGVIKPLNVPGIAELQFAFNYPLAIKTDGTLYEDLNTLWWPHGEAGASEFAKSLQGVVAAHAGWGWFGASVSVVPKPRISSELKLKGLVGEPYRYQIPVTGQATEFSVIGLPAGLSLDAKSGVISGTLSSAYQGRWRLTASGPGGLDGRVVSVEFVSSYPVSLEVVNGSIQSGAGGLVFTVPPDGSYGRLWQEGVNLVSGWYTTEIIVDGPFAIPASSYFPQFTAGLFQNDGNIQYLTRHVKTDLANGAQMYTTRLRVLVNGVGDYGLAMVNSPQVTLRSIRMVREVDGFQVLQDPNLTGIGGFWKGRADYASAIGQIQATPSQTVYQSGSTVTLKAVPTRAFAFSQWTLNGVSVGSANPLTLTVDAAKAVKAEFKAVRYLATSAQGAGRIDRSVTADAYADGASVSVTAVPEKGWEFVSWSGSATGAQPQISLTLNQDQSLTARFRPIFASVPAQSVEERQTWQLKLVAGDVSVVGHKLSFRLVGGPTGMTVDPTSGAVVWTPGEADGGQAYDLQFAVTDTTDAEVGNQLAVRLTVAKVNHLPTLAAVPNATIPESAAWTYPLAGQDLDLPTQTVTYALVSGPSGMSVDGSTGVIRWTPTEAQGPGTHPATVRVSDPDGLFAERTFILTVTEANAAPVLAAIADQATVYGKPLKLTLAASDSDEPANTLTYRLVSGPTNLSVTAAGQLAWNPVRTQVPSSQSITVAVSDGIATTTQSFRVDVFDLMTSVNDVELTNAVSILPPAKVSFRIGRSDWLIFYSVDGTEPNASSVFYLNAFSLSASVTVWPIAFSPDFSQSVVGLPISVNLIKAQTLSVTGGNGLVHQGLGVPISGVSDSGLPVSLSVISGPARLENGQLIPTGGGTVRLKAIQAGNADWAAASIEVERVVAKATQSVTWTPLAEISVGVAPFTVKAVASSGLAVSYEVMAGGGSIAGDRLTITAAGDLTLRATQAGNADFEAMNADLAVSVKKATQTLTFGGIADRVLSTDPIPLISNASSGLPVAFEVLSGPAKLAGNQLTLTGVGAVVLRASQSGNANYEAALPKDQQFNVTRGIQTLTFNPVGAKTFGDGPVTLVAASSASLPVTFRVVSGSGTINGAVLTVTGAGDIVVQAVQPGNEWYQAASINQTVAVAKAVQTLTFIALPNVSYSTNALLLDGKASSGLPVSYRVISGAGLIAGGKLTLGGVGSLAVAADQEGNTNWLATKSVTNSFTVSRGIQSIAFDPIGDQLLSVGSVTLNATSSAGLPIVFTVMSGAATVSGGKLQLLNEGLVTVRALNPGSPLWLAAQIDQSFQVRKYSVLSLSVAGNVGGTVSVAPAKDQYLPTDTLTLTATAVNGFTFSSWSGDLTGAANPSTLTMLANRTVIATFKDVLAPTVVWDQPLAGTTGIEQIRLSGKATDNSSVAAVLWSRDGGPGQAVNFDTSGAFSVENLVLSPGTNRFAVLARDTAGNETKLERQVVWVPQRILQIANAVQVQEGQRLVFPVNLSSSGDIAGLTFELRYDPAYLADPQVEWGALAGQSVNNVNLATAGEITATFSMAGSAVAAGSQRLATVSFRGRSVPAAMTVNLEPRWISGSSSTGALLANGNAIESGSGRIVPRRIKGDNNANQRIDIGDAVLISRLQVKLEEVRSWDIGLNDLNSSGSIDNGDVVKALRTVVGLDPQPSPGSEGKRLSSALGLAKVLVNTNDVMAIELLDGPKATVGQPYRVAVRLNRVKGSLSGLSFALKYPGSLTLTDKQVGALVPGDALPFWNESTGQVSLAAIRSTAWANATGVAAVLTFVPSAAFSGQAEWPLKLEQVEITGSGFDVRPVDPVAAVIQSGGGTVDNRPQLTLEPPKADGTLGLEIRAPQGATVAVETTSDLSAWTETQRITGQGAGSPVKITLQPDPNVQTKFWRVRVR